MDLTIRTSDAATIRLLDGLVVFWFVLWLVVGGWSGYTIWNLSDLGDTVTESGESIQSAGEALEALGGVPLVGERPLELGREASATGVDIAQRGQQVESELRQLSLLLGLAIALMPTTPVLGLYIPQRLARRRDLKSLSRALRSSGSHSESGSDSESAATLDRYLAERAIRSLPYASVHALVGDPWRALDDGRSRPLADAELARVGLRRP